MRAGEQERGSAAMLSYLAGGSFFLRRARAPSPSSATPVDARLLGQRI